MTHPDPTLTRRDLMARAAAAAAAALLLPRAGAAETPAAAAVDADKFKAADAAIEAAIAERQIPGAVLCAGRRSGVVYLKAYGNRAVEPAPVAMAPDTVFDLASLSKPTGCATSVMKLVEDGKISVTDRVAKYLPPFGANGKQDVTIEHLLLHRGGVIPDNPMSDFTGTPEEMMRRTLEVQLKYEPGTKVVYSDVGFMALGELVKVVSGRPLNEFARDAVFKPAGMNDTTYLPGDALKSRCAPTEQRDGKWIVGEVHDPRAYALGGVAGHAGLFGTANDLARYCRMIMGAGELEGARVLRDATVAEMTRPRALPDGTGVRTYGFDCDTGYSSPRGERFPKGKTFGHTGFTGTSYWMDPVNDAFVILLTNAVHPKSQGKPINPVRRAVGTAAADALLPPGAGESVQPPQPAGGGGGAGNGVGQ
jgi:CubicO group peptidase (beta-lactamase class C family)